MVSYYITIILIPLMLISCTGNPHMQGYDFDEGKWIDLSHDFSKDTIYWPTGEHFQHEEAFYGETEKGYFYSSYNYSAAEHGGTHVDAPIHFYRGKNTVEEITLDRLIGKAVVIDVSESCLKDPDHQITTDQITDWEDKHGVIPEGSILMLRTGFGNYWPDKLKYLGTDQTGPEAVNDLHFPGLHPDAAEWIIENRDVSAIGIDTASIDYGQSTHYRSHRILFGKNIPVFENVANLDMLPARGAGIIALPMKIQGGSGAPLRIIAHLP